MAKQGLFVTEIPELSQVWRPLHQYKWSVYEERDTLVEPHKPGFKKVLSNGQVFAIARNGGTQLGRAKYVAPTVGVLDDSVAGIDLVAPELLSGKVDINFAATVATAYAEDVFEDGFLYFHGSNTGVGLSIPVAGNSARAASTANTMRITLDGELFIELDDDNLPGVRVATSPFRNIAIAGAGASFGGVPPDVVSPNAYFWLQLEGPAVVELTGTIAVGAALTPAASGNLTAATAGGDANEPIVAYALEGGAGEKLVYLTG